MGRHRVLFLASTVLGCVILVLTQPIEAQKPMSWADVKTAASRDDIVVNLVIPGSGTVPSRVERVKAKVGFGSSFPGPFSVVAIADPNTCKTCILTGSRFFISGKSGMVGISADFGTLSFYSSFWESPTTPGGMSDAIARFTAEFSEQQAAAHWERTPRVRLVGPNMPSDFYVVGSQPVDAPVQAFDVRDGVLRLEKRSHSGTLGTFWVDLATHKLIKTQFKLQT
jgi:hypothetical protein